MTTVKIPCPACHKSLCCNDPSALARRQARCPSCQHRFWAKVSARVPQTNPVASPSPRSSGEVEASANAPHPMLWWGIGGGAGLLGLAILGSFLGTAARPARASLEPESTLAQGQREIDQAKKQLEAERQQIALDRLLDQGRTALTQNRLAEAEKLFAEAQRLAPKDAAAAAGRKEVGQAQAEQARLTAEQTRQKAEAQRLLSEGRRALAEGNLVAASQAFEKALEISPDDRSVQKGLKDVQELQAREKAAADKEQQFQRHLKTAETYLAAGRPQDALQEYEAALRLKPGDGKVTEGLENAEFQVKLARARQVKAVEEAEARRKAEEAEQLRLAREDARRAEESRARQDYLMALLQSRPAPAPAPAPDPAPAPPAPGPSAGPGGPVIVSVSNTTINRRPLIPLIVTPPAKPGPVKPPPPPPPPPNPTRPKFRP